MDEDSLSGIKEILDDYEQLHGYAHGGSLTDRLRFALQDHRMRVKSKFQRWLGCLPPEAIQYDDGPGRSGSAADCASLHPGSVSPTSQAGPSE